MSSGSDTPAGVASAPAPAGLRSRRQRQVQERLVAGPDWVEGDFVFASSLGRPLAASWVYRSFKRIPKDHKMRDLRFHDLRHHADTGIMPTLASRLALPVCFGHPTRL